ncbi:MAG TPA: response regulator transcription factor [Nitrospira sp.]|nr:response regulator transcription factor [Nitrospira sp.]
MVTAQRIKVLLVDDHLMFRQGLRSLLQSYPDIDVIAEASDGEEAVSKVATHQPAVVVMDISMPKMDGVAATRLLKSQHSHVTVLGLSVTGQGYQVDAMLKAGAAKVLTKEKAVDDLYDSIKRAAA